MWSRSRRDFRRQFSSVPWNAKEKLIDDRAELTRPRYRSPIESLRPTLGQSLWFEDRGEALTPGFAQRPSAYRVDYAGEWAISPAVSPDDGDIQAPPSQCQTVPHQEIKAVYGFPFIARSLVIEN